MKKFIALMLSMIMTVGLGLGLASCKKKEGEEKNNATYAHLNRDYLFGIDEPILEVKNGNYVVNANGEYSHTVENFDLEKTAYLMGATGVKSLRFRFPVKFLRDSNTVNPDLADYMKRAISLLKENGVVQLIGMLEVYPYDTGFAGDSTKSVPGLDDESYDEWMDAVATSCETICRAFPEITMWEMGNEMNSEVFFHPNGYQAASAGNTLGGGTGGFAWDEHVLVYTDYMYYAAKGIHAANPNNVAFTGGYAFTTGTGDYDSIKWFVEDTYEVIKNEQVPTNGKKDTNVRSYFDGLSWHPYTAKSSEVNENWLNGNNLVYQVAIDNGDAGIPVIFTEFGFRDYENAEDEQLQIGYMEKAYDYMLNDMPYVVACCAFRLYQCKYATTWGGEGQNTWGYFTEDLTGVGIYPRKKALALQKLYGGTGDLYKYAKSAVKFISNGGDKVRSQTVAYNGRVAEPALTSKVDEQGNAYVLIGWYNGDKKWDFGTDIVTQSTLTLTAKWRLEKYGPTLPSGGL